jgi:hypothetical protein
MPYNKIPNGTKKAIHRQLKKQFSEEIANKKWNQIMDIYNVFQQEQPYIGGKRNVLYEQLYASLAMFAYYEVMNKTPSIHAMENLAVDALIGNNRIFGKILNFNWKWFQAVYSWMYLFVQKNMKPHIADGSWNNTWEIELRQDEREGVDIRLIGCPVFDFAKKHSYEEIMPAFCKSDYKVFEPFHCRMIRYHTIANGDDYCEFWQVGDKSRAWVDADKDRLL